MHSDMAIMHDSLCSCLRGTCFTGTRTNSVCIILASTNVKMYPLVYMVGARLVCVGIPFMGTDRWVSAPKSMAAVPKPPQNGGNWLGVTR